MPVRRVLFLSLILGASAPAAARQAVDAAPPTKIAVTVYRDPSRGVDEDMDRDWPEGFAMISETRQVTLPPGESTIRFEGVAEGMVAVTAIVTGLPGGTIEKNRNADLLSPAALVDGTLGNRVTVTRTDPATGRESSEQAIVRTRADGGLVLQTSAGFEAVGCSGLPERLTFDHVPAGLSARPVYSVDTAAAQGGTYTVTLTYLASGFDWQAHYVATLHEGGTGGGLRMHLLSWLTLVNDNGQSFPEAELMAVAGKLQVTSDYRDLADAPQGRPLQLTCYPLGHTADGTPDEFPAPPPYPPPPPPPVAPAPMMAEAITVTAMRRSPAMVAREEDLADLKLYRVPEPVTIAANGQKQIAFLDRDAVTGRLLYTASCTPWAVGGEREPAGLLLTTVNDRAHGLGAALPMGGVTVFEAGKDGEQLVGENRLRDYAAGQDVEFEMGKSTQVFAACSLADLKHKPGDLALKAVLTNANAAPVRVRLSLGSGDVRVGALAGTLVRDGERVYEFDVPANGSREVRWTTAGE